MARFDNGVRWYTPCTLTVYMPEDDLACRWCQLMGCESISGRKYCKMTGEILCSDMTIGYNCPLKPQVVTEDMDKESEDL